MKLASVKHGRDGKLVAVSGDLARCAPATGIADTMQDALDRWRDAEPALRKLAQAVESGTAPDMRPFDPALCAAPLPRARRRVEAWPLFEQPAASLEHRDLADRSDRGGIQSPGHAQPR